MSRAPHQTDLRPEADSAGRMTGAAALTLLLASSGITTVYAYPGTSELALCAAIARHPQLQLINARGDKEAAFMAAGANLLRPGSAASILHGARGLTNALGAIADTRRSETPALHIVGQATRSTAPFLPPHAEPALLTSAAAFARGYFDCATVEGLDASALVQTTTRALAALRARPHGPVLLGIPQDLLEHPFVPAGMPAGLAAPPATTDPGHIDAAAGSLTDAHHPVILVDDYLLLGGPISEAALGRLARATKAPVLQVAYRRGPMLFQRIRPTRVPTFHGPYDPGRTEHRQLLHHADLLITIEDRNMYPRVVGPLPRCPKIAITSNLSATLKNAYLTASDHVLHGDVPAILDQLTAALATPAASTAGRRHPAPVRPQTDPGCRSAQALIKAIGQGLSTATDPVIIDDSQTFGGLIARYYDLQPEPLRVFGSHGGFVGSGLATAVGAAMASPQSRIVCTLGDQGFTNGVQALGVAGELAVPLLVIVCNNGGTVSLNLQARADELPAEAATEITRNNPAMSYTTIAIGYGLSASTTRWPGCHEPTSAVDEASSHLAATIRSMISQRTAHLLEIVTPNDPDFWRNTWEPSGQEDVRAGRTAARSAR